KIQLSYPTGYGNPLWIADANRKAINIGDYHGKAKWVGHQVKGEGVTLIWQLPLRDGSFATIEETYSPAKANIYDTHYTGLRRDIWIDLPEQHRANMVGIENSYGVGGTCDGHTTYNLNHGTSLQRIEWRSDKPTASKRAAWGYSPRQTLGAMAQPFIFIDHAKGNLIIYPDRLDYAWTSYLQNRQAEKQDGIWPNFEITVGEKSRRFHVGTINYIFSTDRTKHTPQRWLDAFSYMSNYYSGVYGLENRRLFAHMRHFDVMYEMRATWTNWYDGRTLAEQKAKWLKKMGCDAVMIDIWKYMQRTEGAEHEMYTSCSVDTLGITPDFGGVKGLKEFCDIMHANGVSVILWVNFQYVSHGKMSQVDGGSGSSLLRKHPEWRLLDRNGNTRGRGLTVMSFASGWKDYLVSSMKYLKDVCGVDGYYVDNSAGAVRLTDYGVEPPAVMMKHYWDIVHELQDYGLAMFFEESGGLTINGGAGYVWRNNMTMDGTEWGLTKGAPTGVHTQSSRQRGLLHQNASGCHTLRRLTGGDAQQSKYMIAFYQKHGFPDRIRLVNLRQNAENDRWEYDNTEWVYEDKSVPYKVINSYHPAEIKAEEGSLRSGTAAMLAAKGGKSVRLRPDKPDKGYRLVWVADVLVNDPADLVDMLKIQLSTGYTVSGVNQTVQLYNFSTGEWDGVDTQKKSGKSVDVVWSKLDTGGHYVSNDGRLRLRVVAESSKWFRSSVDFIEVTIDEGTGLRRSIMAKRNKTDTSPSISFPVGGEPRMEGSPSMPARRAAPEGEENKPDVPELASQDEDTIESLIAKLTSPLQARTLAAFRLGERGDKRAVPVLIKALKDEEWRARDRAAQALYKIGDPSAAPALAEMLADPVWRVRFWAAKALRYMKSTDAVPALIKAVEDEHQGVTEHVGLA
ncbi:MAG: HEAT repeat domain-containing protein, partial [Phycisphaerae bacterium]|nr:HEAT repeat domain-containing protein [Phycisphaerae bacterium]